MSSSSSSSITSRKKPWKSLATLLVCFEGEEISVELKDGLRITGLLDSVDTRDMSVLIGKARQEWVEGRKAGEHGPNLELVFIAGGKIRFIHFPDKLNIDAELRRWHKRKQHGSYKPNVIVDK